MGRHQIAGSPNRRNCEFSCHPSTRVRRKSSSRCNQIITLPGPVTPVQHPFLTYLTSLQKLNSNVDSELITQLAVTLNDPNNVKLMGTGQAEIAFAFRSANAGVISQLGFYGPTAGAIHTVTLWDSATGQVLVQTNVTTNAAGEWSYAGVGGTNQVLGIEASHGYIIGFNSLAVGVPINTDTTANLMYVFNGIYDFKVNSPPVGIPMLPFTQFGITFERWYQHDYDTPVNGPIFPSPNDYQSDVWVFFGPVDIEFTPAP